jgi:DNA-binding GntR family transcriptional regulator
MPNVDRMKISATSVRQARRAVRKSVPSVQSPNSKAPHGLGRIGPTLLVRDQAVQRLRSAIISGELEPGMRLIERELCESMGVSRTSVREVLRQLQAERLIEVEPRRGPIVARLTAATANEIYDVRARLEGLLVRRYVAHASDKDVRTLRTIVTRFTRAAGQGDVPLAVEVMVEFYSHLAAVAQAQVIGELLDQLIARVSVLRSTSMSQPGRMADSVREIKAILQAIERRDVDAAEKAAVSHVRHAQTAALEGLSKQAQS